MAREEPQPNLFVIFGGTGDLTKRKLLPALTALAARDALPPGSAVLSAAKEDLDDAGYRAWARGPLMDAGLPEETVRPWCEQCLFYQPLRGPRPEDYRAIAARIEELERARGLPGNRIFYLALPPAAFGPTAEALGRAGLNRAHGWARLVIEKPFGRDLDSACELNRVLHAHFEERQVYRIDHYLGKETVQNLLVFRFANPLFESVWNRDRVESVQILVAEPGGVGHRAGYYEQSGALRDMVQNHLTQLLTLVAMEPPAAFDAESIRAEKVKVLRAIAPIAPDHVVLGQYAAGAIEGRPVPGYREDEGVAAESMTETFAALRLDVANWRWQGVPFVVRTGKRLARRLTRILVKFRHAPISIFQPYNECKLHANALAMTLQPDEGFDLAFEVKSPGAGVSLVTQRLHFEYAEAFGPLYDAYETLLLDVMSGDQTLFVHAHETEESWRLYTPLLERTPAPQLYPAGSWGPVAADHLAPVGDVVRTAASEQSPAAAAAHP